MIEIGNGNKIVNCQICDSRNGKLILNGKEISKPPVEMNNVTMIDGNVLLVVMNIKTENGNAL